MKVAVYGQYYKSEAIEYMHILFDVLKENNIDFYIEKRFSELIIADQNTKTFTHHRDLDSSFDMMLTIGGDGTFLRAVTFVRDLNIPILGINTGRLGFLATVQKEQIKQSIEALINKDYMIKERSLLSVETSLNNNEFDGVNFALNEITIARKNTTSMITIETHLDDEYLTSYWADGLIVSTPTGSTGYSLSCDGPVIMPQAKSLVLTPIAPHNLSARPLVIPDDISIKLKVSSREKQALISLDSRIFTIDNETEILVKKAPFTIKTLQLKNQTFLKTLREKLLWGEDKRN
ncbi:MAG: NAD kinase [Flavobacteriaceae bacterium]|nr:NAD kinase [Flavobacteriaceae bacterium]